MRIKGRNRAAATASAVKKRCRNEKRYKKRRKIFFLLRAQKSLFGIRKIHLIHPFLKYLIDIITVNDIIFNKGSENFAKSFLCHDVPNEKYIPLGAYAQHAARKFKRTFA